MSKGLLPNLSTVAIEMNVDKARTTPVKAEE
jgi:hypothetical protein